MCPAGSPIMEPIHLAYKNKRVGTGGSTLMSVIPACSRIANADNGKWFNTRYEMAPGSLVLIEHRIADSVRQFEMETTYMLLVCDERAPLHRIVGELPSHFLADQNAVYFVGRLRQIQTDQQLFEAVPAQSALAVYDYFKIEHPPQDVRGDYIFDSETLSELDDILTSNTDNERFTFEVLEQAPKGLTKTVTVTSSAPVRADQKPSVTIRRTRRINVKNKP